MRKIRLDDSCLNHLINTSVGFTRKSSYIHSEKSHTKNIMYFADGVHTHLTQLVSLRQWSDLRLPSQPHNLPALWPVANYTAWWHRHSGTSSLPEASMRCTQLGLEPASCESQVQCPTNSATTPPTSFGGQNVSGWVAVRSQPFSAWYYLYVLVSL